MWWLVLSLFVGRSQCQLWKQGIVHYSINNKDYGGLSPNIQHTKYVKDRSFQEHGYLSVSNCDKVIFCPDIHSQDIIQKTLLRLQDETCVKFFGTEFSSNTTYDKILYINNPNKNKDCPPISYDYAKKVIDMPIGYKCLNQEDIARIVVDMLRASIDANVIPVNSYDLVMQFKEKDKSPSPYLLSQTDRNYINAHYQGQCESLSLATVRRRSGVVSTQLSEANVKYYENKVWPLAIVLYGIDEDLRGTSNHEKLIHGMTSIQRETCIVFQEVTDIKVLYPKSVIWFGKEGSDMPRYGFVDGNQTIKLSSMLEGAPGHSAHLLNSLLRVLGVPMISNRYDRDNYLTVNWKNVKPGNEQYLEKAPEEAWITQIPYDFNSATHAPANFMCTRVCDTGDTTVQPLQDHLWQRIMSMGHRQVLSDSDVKTLNILYSQQCKNRYVS